MILSSIRTFIGAFEISKSPTKKKMIVPIMLSKPIKKHRFYRKL